MRTRKKKKQEKKQPNKRRNQRQKRTMDPAAVEIDGSVMEGVSSGSSAVPSRS